MLRAERFKNDPRVLQAKQLLLEAMQEHVSDLKQPCAKDSTLSKEAEATLKEYNELRGAPLFYPFLGSGFGSGSLVELIDGSVKYDMITGIGVQFFGHNHPVIAEAAIDAALSDTIMQGNLQQNLESFTLASMLTRRSGLPHCFFSTSGVMVNENAVKVAFQKRFPANRILAFDHCFSGRSLTFSQVTDKPTFREGLPLNQPVDYIPFYDHRRPEESVNSAVKMLSQHIARYPGSHAIMMYELVQGEAGFYTAPKEFFEPLMKICKENKIAVFADEVQSFARTEALFAYQMLGLQNYIDIAGIGKLSQVCATLFTEEYKPRPGLLSQTFTGSTAAILSCIKILEMLKDEIYYGKTGRMAKIHQRFTTHLQRIEKEHPSLIQGPFGVGGMIAFTPFDGSHNAAVALSKALFERGVLSFIAGTNPTRIRFLVPALVITDEEIDQVMIIVERVLKELQGNV